jgi:hypothetical protein
MRFISIFQFSLLEEAPSVSKEQGGPNIKQGGGIILIQTSL